MKRRWTAALAQRRAVWAPASAAAKLKFRKQVLANRATARKKMGQAAEAAPRGEERDNSTSLPPASLTKRARNFERWCLFHSWAQCSDCGALQPRDLTEATLSRDQKVSIPAGQCSRCQAARNVAPVCLEDVPPELRGLRPETAALLGPLEVDVGPEARASQNPGYCQHAALIRFRWQTKPVKERLKTIDNQECQDRLQVPP